MLVRIIVPNAITTILFTTSRVHAFSTLVAFTSAKTPSPSIRSNTRMSMTDSTYTNSKHEKVTLPLQKLSDYANSYAAVNGLQVETKRKDNDDDTSNNVASYQCAPISLLPNVFPGESYSNAVSLAPHFNLLVDRISRDGDFLQETLGGEGGVTSRDGYTKLLLDMYREIYMEKDDAGKFARTAGRLGILRSDYMLHRNDDESGGAYELKQVELNTIASSFAGLSSNVAGLHQMLTKRFPNEIQDWIDASRDRVMGDDTTGGHTGGVPNNTALTCLPEAMTVAHRHYDERFARTASPNERVILFVVQEGETNTVDQRMLEFELWERHGVPVVRMSLTRADTNVKLDEETGSLYVLPHDSSDEGGSNNWCEVSVVYFRAGYAPTDYPDGDDGIEWKARKTMERSKATKCPNLGYHLAGTKKVQQALARPGVVERFFAGDPKRDELVRDLKGAFAGLYSLGEDAVKEDLDAVTEAISGGEGGYVLKPQREGGGYNYYGDRLAAKLKENLHQTEDGEIKLGKELAEFILMQRLFPPQQRSVLLRAGKVEGTGESISELGCFGTIVATHEGEALHNQYSGYILRTKFSDVDEGGVASGFATLSSPYLC